MNDQPVGEDGLQNALASQPRQTLVVVRADRVTVLERFVKVVDDIRGMGFQQVSLEVIRS